MEQAGLYRNDQQPLSNQATLFFTDFIVKQVVEAVAARTGEDDAEEEDAFLKRTRGL